MGFIQGEDEPKAIVSRGARRSCPGDHVCRVIDAFVARLEMSELGSSVASRGNGTARLRSARSFEALSLRLPAADPFVTAFGGRVPAQRGSDVVAGRLAPDYKSIAEFRRMHREAVTARGPRWLALRARWAWYG